MSNVSVIGLDPTGSTLVTALLAQGYRVCACARPLESTAALVAGGATVTTRVEDAVAASDLLIVCTDDYLTARTLLERAGKAIHGRMLVTLTRGGPVEAQAMARWAEARALLYLDGRTVTVSAENQGTETLVLYSGSQTFFRVARRELGALGESRFVGDDPIMASLLAPALTIVAYGVCAHPARELTDNDGADSDPLLAQVLPYLDDAIDLVPDLIHQVVSGIIQTRLPCAPFDADDGFRLPDRMTACPKAVRQRTLCGYRNGDEQASTTLRAKPNSI